MLQQIESLDLKTEPRFPSTPPSAFSQTLFFHPRIEAQAEEKPIVRRNTAKSKKRKNTSEDHSDERPKKRAQK